MKQRRGKRLTIELEKVERMYDFYYADLPHLRFILCSSFVRSAKRGCLPERLRLIISKRRFKRSTPFIYTATETDSHAAIIAGHQKVCGGHYMADALAGKIKRWLKGDNVGMTRLYGRLDTVRKGRR